jgi:hypothetical protein
MCVGACSQSYRRTQALLASKHPDLEPALISLAKPFKFQLLDLNSLYDVNWEVQAPIHSCSNSCDYYYYYYCYYHSLPSQKSQLQMQILDSITTATGRGRRATVRLAVVSPQRRVCNVPLREGPRHALCRFARGK